MLVRDGLLLHRACASCTGLPVLWGECAVPVMLTIQCAIGAYQCLNGGIVGVVVMQRLDCWDVTGRAVVTELMERFARGVGSPSHLLPSHAFTHATPASVKGPEALSECACLPFPRPFRLRFIPSAETADRGPRETLSVSNPKSPLNPAAAVKGPGATAAAARCRS